MADQVAALTEYDTRAILARVDLVDLIDKAIGLKKIANSGELGGPCPKGCGHRVHVVPGEGGGFWWFCRACYPHDNNKAHDAIAWVQWAENKTFPEACESLGGEKGQKAAPQAPRLTPPQEKRDLAARLPTAAAPGDLWQARGRAFLAFAQEKLWGDPQALGYLRGRGLSEDTIRAAGLGYCPKAYRDKAAAWGLDPAEYPKGVWLPVGWVIPCETAGTLAYIKVRRPEGEPKYACVSGSKKAGAIYGLDLVGGAFDLCIVEGEISALSLRQELAGVAAVVSVGDAGGKPTAAALATMATVPRWWAVFDHDKAGTSGAAFWGELSARVRPLPWPWGDRGEKYDCNDALRAGEDLAAWAIPHLGPSPEGKDKRQAWARFWLDSLWDAAGDETAPAWRVWRTLLDEYMNLGPDYSPGELWRGGDPQGGDPATYSATSAGGLDTLETL